jgi:hypothetical protein
LLSALGLQLRNAPKQSFSNFFRTGNISDRKSVIILPVQWCHSDLHPTQQRIQNMSQLEEQQGMKHKFMVLGLLVGALIFTSACGMVSSLMGGSSSGTVNDLWSDVPRMDGLTKTDMEMPLAVRLGLQAMLQGRMDFIAYTTDATPQAVVDFYTAERMTEQGWTDAQGTGCYGGETETTAEGGICVFNKVTEDKSEVLGIVTALDEETGKTAVFFARVDTTEAATEEASN